MKNILFALFLGVLHIWCSQSTENRINKDDLVIDDGIARHLGELYTGIAVVLHSEGIISKQFPYQNGVLSGEYKEWYRNGTLEEKGMLKDGKKDGKWTGWGSDGELRGEVEFTNGVANGHCLIYQENESTRKSYLSEDIIFENGNKISSTFYDEEGNEIDNPYKRWRWGIMTRITFNAYDILSQ